MSQDYVCGECGSTALTITPTTDLVAFDLFCGNGHKVVPVPGTEYTVGEPEV